MNEEILKCLKSIEKFMERIDAKMPAPAGAPNTATPVVEKAPQVAATAPEVSPKMATPQTPAVTAPIAPAPTVATPPVPASPFANPPPVVPPAPKERELPKRSSTPTASDKKNDYIPSHEREKSFDPMNGMLLALIGVGCVVIASVLLIKFSIEAGWLNPSRQIIIATLVGIGLILTPHVRNFSDKKLIGYLPAAGVIILHLTVYGAVFHHQLASPLLGLLGISVIGFISIMLLNEHKDTSYAVLSIVGTYIGAMSFSKALPELWMMGAFLLLWDVIFSYFALSTKKRVLILLAGYLSIALVVIYEDSFTTLSPEMSFSFALLQLLQALVFAGASALYTKKHQSPFSASEIWAYFPLLLLFYGQEYWLLYQVNHFLADIVSIGFSAVLFGLYHMARKSLNKTQLESGVMIHTFCAAVLVHVLYFSNLELEAQTLVSFGLIGLLFFFGKKMSQEPAYRGVLILVLLCVAYNAGMVLAGTLNTDANIVFGGAYALLGIAAYFYSQATKTFDFSKDHENMLLLFAHAQSLISLYRLKEYTGDGAVAPMWIAYACALLIYAWRKKHFHLAQASLPIIFISIGRFVFLDFGNLGTLERIISLFLMGGLIFGGGYIYRQCAMYKKEEAKPA